MPQRLSNTKKEIKKPILFATWAFYISVSHILYAWRNLALVVKVHKLGPKFIFTCLWSPQPSPVGCRHMYRLHAASEWRHKQLFQFKSININDLIQLLLKAILQFNHLIMGLTFVCMTLSLYIMAMYQHITETKLPFTSSNIISLH